MDKSRIAVSTAQEILVSRTRVDIAPALDRDPSSPVGQLDEHDSSILAQGREPLHHLNASPGRKDLTLPEEYDGHKPPRGAGRDCHNINL